MVCHLASTNMLQNAEMTIVTGPPRSGTSCVTGLLEQCGYDLGRLLPVLRDPTPFNPKGHFELEFLSTINQRLCLEAVGGGDGFYRIPECSAMDALAARRQHYFRLFIGSFDGNLCKDPLMCLTWPYWRQHWPALTRVVFCLRHPLTVADSMMRRYGITLDHALALWEVYTCRFFRPVAAGIMQIYIFDFDAFCAAPAAMLTTLLQWLEKPIDPKQIHRCVDDFFGLEFVHGNAGLSSLDQTPAAVRPLYAAMKALAGQGYVAGSRVLLPLAEERETFVVDLS